MGYARPQFHAAMRGIKAEGGSAVVSTEEVDTPHSYAPTQARAAGEVDDIRECIGRNVCVTGDYTMTPIRCTQNPTMGEEWRKGARGARPGLPLHQMNIMQNVQILRGSRVTASEVLEFGAERVVLATAASWRRDGFWPGKCAADPRIRP